MHNSISAVVLEDMMLVFRRLEGLKRGLSHVTTAKPKYNLNESDLNFQVTQ